MKIIDMAEAARLRAAALNGKTQASLRMLLRKRPQAQRKLRQHVLEAHVRSIDVVRPIDANTLEVPAAVMMARSSLMSFEFPVG